jgi:hypothetical protein
MSRIICHAARLSAPSGAGPMASETEHCGQKQIRCAGDFWRGLTPTVCANRNTATDFCPASSSRLQRRQYRLSKSSVPSSEIYSRYFRQGAAGRTSMQKDSGARTSVDSANCARPSTNQLCSSQNATASRTLLQWGSKDRERLRERQDWRDDAGKLPRSVTACANAALNFFWFKPAADDGFFLKAAWNRASRPRNPLRSRLLKKLAFMGGWRQFPLPAISNDGNRQARRERCAPDLSRESRVSWLTSAKCRGSSRHRNRIEIRVGFRRKERSKGCSKIERPSLAPNLFAWSSARCRGFSGCKPAFTTAPTASTTRGCKKSDLNFMKTGLRTTICGRPCWRATFCASRAHSRKLVGQFCG